MKNLIQASAIVLFAGIFTACGTDAPKNEVIQVTESNTRGGQTFKFKNAEISLQAKDFITINAKAATNKAEDDDVAFVSSLFNNLQTAENSAAMLDVAVTLSEEKITDGTFVFALDVQEAKALTFELFDEEGFELAGANNLDVTQGKNYKAINVKALNDGQYIMRLRDKEGKELTQKFAIEAQK